MSKSNVPAYFPTPGEPDYFKYLTFVQEEFRRCPALISCLLPVMDGAVSGKSSAVKVVNFFRNQGYKAMRSPEGVVVCNKKSKGAE